MKIQATNVFERNWNADTRFVVNIGGTRSSKTHSICQMWLLKLVNEQNKVLSIARKELTVAKKTVKRTLDKVIFDLNLQNKITYNKQEAEYTFGTNKIELLGADNPQKLHGMERHYLWFNEANEMSIYDFRQANQRTSEKVFLDFNPSDEFHWIYDEILTRKENITEIHSTYKDNPFLPQALIDEIENYKNIDENYWRIYGLGLRGVSNATIYYNWKYANNLPENYDIEVFGIDWGFNHPTVVVQCREKDGEYYVNEFFYESKKTSSEFISLMTNLIPKNAVIIADTEDPNRINEMYYAGWRYIKPAIKGAGSIKRGIGKIKSNPLYITKNSTNLIKEIRSYKWKVDKDGRVSDNEPVKINDHGMDAMRYAIDYMVESKVSFARVYNNKPAGF